MLDKLSLKKGYFYTITGVNGTGKSRKLIELSEFALKEIKQNKKYSRIICLAGTVYERFKIPKNVDAGDIYCYLGQKTNNNMFSGLAPYRNLFEIFCKEYSEKKEYTNQLKLIKELFMQIGFDEYVGLSLRNKKGEGNISKDDKFYSLYLEEDLFKDKITSLKKNISKSIISDIFFSKGGKKYNLNELSSGERSILLMILGVTFIIKDESIVFFDEPENSMHPKWQEFIIQFLQKIVRDLSANSTIVIATHSPLIISCIKNDNNKIIELGIDNDWRDENYSKNTNIENILYRVFNKITPQSHLLSIEIAKIVNDFSHGVIDIVSARKSLEELKHMGVDETQNNLIQKIIDNLGGLEL